MRSIVIILLSGMVCFNTATAKQKTDVPANIRSAFSKSYPGAAKVKWDKEDNRYEASFHYKKEEMSVVYNSNGAVAETETEIAVEKLPAAARKYASAKGKIKEASKIDLADGTIRYEAEVNHKDLMFDSNGKFIEEKVEKDEKD